MYGLEWFRNKKITVMGLGLHGGGVGIAKWLMRHGAVVTVTDLKDPAQLAASVAELEKTYQEAVFCFGESDVHRFIYVLGRHEEKDFTEANMVIQNPAVPRDNPFLSRARSRQVPVESDISLFFLLCPYPITAVTGTKGKTTTTTLLADICEAHDRRTVVGGNIRISPMDALDGLLEMKARKKPVAPPPIVLELSSWQLEGLEKHRLSPRVAVITNIMEDHLNRYNNSMDDYARAKELNVMFQGAGDTAILNAGDGRLAAIGHKLLASGQPRVWWFAEKPVKKAEGCFVRTGKIVLAAGGKETTLLPLRSLKILGSHNVGNVLAACAAAAVMGIPVQTIAKVVREFHGVPGRLEEIAAKRGIRFVNDTTATTPDAAIAALRALSAGQTKKIILLAGGADKALRFEDWAKQVRRHVKYLVLFEGAATVKMEAALAAAGNKVLRGMAKTMPEAVKLALMQAERGDVILLSPGCASFGLFINEFDRGDQFVAEVKKLR